MQACDSLSLRLFLGSARHEATPDYSTLSRTRLWIPVETREQVFARVLGRLHEAGLVAGEAVDSTTLGFPVRQQSLMERISWSNSQAHPTR